MLQSSSENDGNHQQIFTHDTNRKIFDTFEKIFQSPLKKNVDGWRDVIISGVGDKAQSPTKIFSTQI